MSSYTVIYATLFNNLKFSKYRGSNIRVILASIMCLSMHARDVVFNHFHLVRLHDFSGHLKLPCYLHNAHLISGMDQHGTNA